MHAVDTIIKDLMDASMLLVKELKTEQFRGEIGPAVETRIIEELTGPAAAPDTVESFRELLRDGALDDKDIVVEVPVKDNRGGGPGGGGGGGPEIDVSVASMGGTATVDLSDFMQRMVSVGSRGAKPQVTRKTMKVSAWCRWGPGGRIRRSRKRR